VLFGQLFLLSQEIFLGKANKVDHATNHAAGFRVIVFMPEDGQPALAALPTIRRYFRSQPRIEISQLFARVVSTYGNSVRVELIFRLEPKVKGFKSQTLTKKT